MDTESSPLPAILPRTGRGSGPFVEPFPPETRDAAYLAWLRHDGNLTAVASELGVSHDTIGRWKRVDGWIARQARTEHELSATARRRVEGALRELAPRAIARLAAIMDDAEAPVEQRRLAARDLLDRAGYTPVKRILLDQRVQSLNLHATVDPDTPPHSTEDAIAILQRLLGDDQR